MPARGLGLGARPGINGLLGFQGWLGILPSAHTLKVVNNEASEEESVKEVVAKDFERFPLIFGLHVSGNIVEPVPEKENKTNGNCFVYLYLFGNSGVYITWALSLKLPVPLCHAQRSKYLAKEFRELVG